MSTNFTVLSKVGFRFCTKYVNFKAATKFPPSSQFSSLVNQQPLTTAAAGAEPMPQPKEIHESSSTNMEQIQKIKKCNDFVLKKRYTVPPELRLVLPDFMPEPDFSRRNPIAEKLERMDMLRRRQVIDIPEFYVGSIMAVTVSDEHATKCANRFVGICINRNDRGLRHHFTLRNVVDGYGVEVMYNIYNPLVQRIEVLKLEKRLDDELYYLRDALPEYSTFPFNMETSVLPPGTPVPVNPLKVKLRPPPWCKRWERKDVKGIDNIWEMTHESRKNLFVKTRFEPWKKFDIVEQYKYTIPAADQQTIYEELSDHDFKQSQKSGRKTASILAPFKVARQKTAPKRSGNTQEHKN